MARVDVADDSVRRFIVRHYRYDPDRHERRHVVVAVFDNKREYQAALEQARADLQRRRDRGEQVDAREHISGTVRDPGDDRRAANGHLLIRASRHGVALGDWIDDLELPSNMGVMRSGRARRSLGAGSRLRSRISRWLGRSRSAALKHGPPSSS